MWIYKGNRRKPRHQRKATDIELIKRLSVHYFLTVNPFILLLKCYFRIIGVNSSHFFMLCRVIYPNVPLDIF